MRATDLAILTQVMETHARNCDRYFGQVVVPNSPDYLGNTSARAGCDLGQLANRSLLLGGRDLCTLARQQVLEVNLT